MKTLIVMALLMFGTLAHAAAEYKLYRCSVANRIGVVENGSIEATSEEEAQTRYTVINLAFANNSTILVQRGLVEKCGIPENQNSEQCSSVQYVSCRLMSN